MTTLKQCPETPNCVCSLFQEDRGHFIKPIVFPNEPTAQKAFHTLPAILIQSYHATLLTSSFDFFHFVCTTRFLRFKDDVTFTITGNTIHMRSASRVGYSDLGTNRKRLEKIRHLLIQGA